MTVMQVNTEQSSYVREIGSAGVTSESGRKKPSKPARALELLRVLAGIDKQFQARVELPWRTKLQIAITKYLYMFRSAAEPDVHRRAPLRVFGRRFHFDNLIGPALLQQMFAEDYYLKRWINPGATVVDIGANIGQFRLFSLEYLRAERVLSFEPVRRTFEFLSRNFSEGVWNLAIGDDADVALYVDDSLTGRTGQTPRAGANRIEIAKSRRLDEIEEIKQLGVIDLLKIDTEGAELDVLRFGIQTLRKSKFLFIEASVDRACSGDLTDLCAFLKVCAPSFKPVHVGHVFDDGTRTGAVDVLFENSAWKARQKPF
jgi:FkbM family methyltransferase